MSRSIRLTAFPRTEYGDGMSLRDWFAGQALASATWWGDVEASNINEIPRACYKIADAMLAERAASEPRP